MVSKYSLISKTDAKQLSEEKLTNLYIEIIIIQNSNPIKTNILKRSCILYMLKSFEYKLIL